jgi:hypothetical protein
LAADINHGVLRSQDELSTSSTLGPDGYIYSSIIYGRCGNIPTVQQYGLRSDIGFGYERVSIDPTGFYFEYGVANHQIGMNTWWQLLPV